MAKLTSQLLLVVALVLTVNSQSYPRFEFRGDVLANNSSVEKAAMTRLTTQTVVAMEKVTGMMRQENTSIDYLERVDCMSLKEMEWSISISEVEEEFQECGDVIFLIVMVYSRAYTSTLAFV